MSAIRSCSFSIIGAYVLGWVVLTSPTGALAQARVDVKRVTWEDTPPSLHHILEAHGLTSAAFPSYIKDLRRAHARRVREGDLDHLVFYLLQSTHYTTLPPIEPALSAKALVEGLPPAERDAFLQSGHLSASRVAGPVRSRVTALMRALDSSATDPRLVYFRALVKTTVPNRRLRDAAILREYLRVMRFVYEKEFVAQRSARGPDAVVELYRSRGLSTDTAVEAGYLVYVGLGVVRSLDPDRRVRRVLVVGPGLDLAPRTGLIEAGPPESYQPWAVIDALIALGLSRTGDLEVVAADINPRVVDHVRRSRAEPPTLTLVSGIGESETVRLSDDYRDYFARLGEGVGDVEGTGRATTAPAGHLHKIVRVRAEAALTLAAETLDVVTERFDGPGFDLIVATNILPYFDDVELMLAMSNVASMLAPGGVFLHNEARPLMRDVTASLHFPFEQSRQAVIATVRGAPAPLVDSVWLHRKARH